MRCLQNSAELSLKIVYLLGLKNSVADALSKQPNEIVMLGVQAVCYMHCKILLFLVLLRTG